MQPVVAPLIAAALCACSSEGPASYDSPRGLADALECEYRPLSSVLGPGTQQGGCDYAGASLSLTTTDPSDRGGSLAEQISGDPRTLGARVLVGHGWLVVSQSGDALRRAQDVLGGELR